MPHALAVTRYIKHTFPRGRSPYTRGSFMANLSALWCGPKAPSILRLRRPLLDDHFMEVEMVRAFLFYSAAVVVMIRTAATVVVIIGAAGCC